MDNLTQNEERQVRHLTFMSKFWLALHAKGFRNSFHIQHVQRIAPIFNVCWSINFESLLKSLLNVGFFE